MPRSIWVAALILGLQLGCTAGPGKKPGTMTLKVYTEKTPLSCPPSVWTLGGLRFELVEARYERRYTVFEDTSHRLYFLFRIRNVSSEAIDLNAFAAPETSLVLADGSPAPLLNWSYAKPWNERMLGPGEESGGRLFNLEHDVPVGARPGTLTIAGQSAQW